MTRPDARRRNAIALAISTVLHVLFFAFIVSYVPTPPPEPELVTEPLNVTIMPMPEIPPPPPEVIIPPKMTPRKIEIAPETPPVPVPAPPKIEPPKPEPAKPEPPKPEPQKPAPTPPKPAPIVAKAALAPIKSAAAAKPIAPKLSPLKAPTLTASTPTLAPPAPVQAPKPPAPSPQASASPSPMVSLDKLNLHKPKKEAPSNVPTLPVAGGPQAGGSPSAAAAAAAAAAALNGAAFEQPGSRLNGLSPYPYGVMPSGGSGLRGSLVGCANAQAVGLSSVERAHCNERFGVQIHHAPVIDGISPGKRAAFDAAAARDARLQNPRGVDPMSAMHSSSEKPCPSEPDIKNSPASFQGCSH